MNTQLSISKELSYEGKPIHVFEYNGRTTLLAQEVATVLGIQNVSRSLRDSTVLEEGTDYDVVPVKNIELTTENVFSIGKNAPNAALFYESGVFLFAIRSNKPMAVPFTRWVIREAIPMAMAAADMSVLSLFDTDTILSQNPQTAAGVHSTVKNKIAEVSRYLKKLKRFANDSEANLIDILNPAK